MLIPEEQTFGHVCLLIQHKTVTEAQLPFPPGSLVKGCGVWVEYWGKEASDLDKKHLAPAAAAAAAAADSVL